MIVAPDDVPKRKPRPRRRRAGKLISTRSPSSRVHWRTSPKYPIKEEIRKWVREEKEKTTSTKPKKKSAKTDKEKDATPTLAGV
jgi:hypothetical protein